MGRNNRKILIIGAGSLGKMTASILVDSGIYPRSNIYFADDCILPGTEVLDFKVLGPVSALGEAGFCDDEFDYVIAVAQNQTRKAIAETYPELNYVNIIHPSAVVSVYARLGRGNIILPNVTVDPDAIIGSHVIINKNSAIGHNVTLENYTQVCAGSALGGHIGECAFLGIGSNVLPNVEVGRHTIIGAGSVVNRDIPENCVAMGVPCRVVKETAPEKIG